MSDRAPAAPDELDYFPTPPWAARAGAELLLANLEPSLRSMTCWEPACGEGHMASALAEYFARVVASDIHPYGYGAQFDFLGMAETPADDWPEVDWIVTNPPFVRGEAFVRRAFPRARRGVAMLLRLVFLEGGGRYRLLYADHPLTAVAPFSERVPMVKGRWDPSASSATAYAWFIWHKHRGGEWPLVMPVPPGSKVDLTRYDDAERWGRAAPSSNMERTAFAEALDEAGL